MMIRRDILRAGVAAMTSATLNLVLPTPAQPGEAEDGKADAGAEQIAKALDRDRWWPVQVVPRSIVRTEQPSTLELQMLVQSVAGLAAKAVNQGRGDELIWVFNNNESLESWYRAFLKAHPTVKVLDDLKTWELVDRYRKRNIIKGYITYRPDRSAGQVNEHRVGMDLSVNVATSLAGLIDGVLIAESLEADARGHGLSKLLDARDKTQAWCFESHQAQFNRRLLCTQDPRKSNVRDLAIAHQALVLYGAEEPLEAAMKWLQPLSPIAGWNGGDEFATTRLSSIYGHLQTATDWCMNLPVLMAGSERANISRAKANLPQNLDWSDGRSCVSFLLTDGDNVQWLQSSFFHGNASYWASPDRGQIPFGWSCCFAQLAQLCPVTIEHALATQTPNDRFVEWGAGYYYPDLFGQARPEGNELLARHARRTWKFMQQTGTRIVAFNVANADSADAFKAYETIARETDDLWAILVFQYSPYEAGAGRTFRVRDRRGIEVPVITARYSIWENANGRARAGTPAKIAREIHDSAADNLPHHDWVNVHAWSYFRRVRGADEAAENMPQEGAAAAGGVRGYSPAVWCAERLPADVRVVPPDELVWRIRMKHDPGMTKKLLGMK